MKIKDIINKIDISKKEDCTDISVFSELFDSFLPILEYYPRNCYIQSYYFAQHYCTDQAVGWKAYFLKDEFMCITSQAGRKCDENIIGWASQDMANRTKEYILSLAKEEDKKVEIINLEEDIKGYPVNFSSQLMTDTVIYKDQECKINDSYLVNSSTRTKINIRYKNKDIDVEMSEVLSPLIIKD